MEHPNTPSPAPLHARNPTGRFSDRGVDYKNYRPSYPAAAIDAILDALGDPARLVAADIGAGTGISARLLADRGVSVFAVEPNAAMRAETAPHPRITWIDATAEATSLPAASVGLVLCAQAFHWFRAPEALAEFHRILTPLTPLTPRGRVALVWNDRDERDELTRHYADLLRAASGRDPAMEDHTRPDALFDSPLFHNARALEFPNEQSLDADGLVGRAASASYVPKDGPKRDALVVGLRELHARLADSGGVTRLRYITRIFLAERALP